MLLMSSLAEPSFVHHSSYRMTPSIAKSRGLSKALVCPRILWRDIDVMRQFLFFLLESYRPESTQSPKAVAGKNSETRGQEKFQACEWVKFQARKWHGHLLFVVGWRDRSVMCDDISSGNCHKVFLLLSLITPPPIGFDEMLRYVVERGLAVSLGLIEKFYRTPYWT